MRVSLRRHNEDLAEIRQKLAMLRATVLEELEESEQHVRGLQATLDSIDGLMHQNGKEVMHDA
jgi:hypothetical protein